MDAEIFVHGVPNGQSFWGKEVDSNYFSKFYGPDCTDAVKYLIQTRNSNGKTFCYYNYLIYKNVIGNDGRGGSYFGLSVRTDVFCKDFIGIYKILDAVFVAHVQNKILNVQNGKYKYLIPDFPSASEKMVEIHDAIWQLLQSALTENDVCDLRDFAVDGGSSPKGNLYDATADSVRETVKQCGKIVLSPYYPTNKENGLVQQCNTLRQDSEKTINEAVNAKEQEYCSLKANWSKESANLEKEKKGKDEIIKQKDSKIAKLQEQISQNEHAEKALQIINLIKEKPINELSNIMGGNRGHGGKENTKHKRNDFFPVKINKPTAILSIVLLSLLLNFLILFYVATKENTSEISPDEHSVSTLVSPQEDEDSINQDSQQRNEDAKTEYAANSTDSTDFGIDVQSYNEKTGKYLVKEKTYTATAKKSSELEPGLWSIKGGIINGDCVNKEVKFIPTSDDKVTITYTQNGQSQTRELKVESTLKSPPFKPGLILSHHSACI